MSHEPRTWALAPGVIWSGGERLESHAVIITGERITAVVPTNTIPPDLPVSHMHGCTLLPGLIDCHVHLADWMLPGFLAAGVTTVRDVGNDLEWVLERRSRAAADPSSSPRILCCGPLLDGENVYWPPIGRSHAGTAEIMASVRELASAGVDAIKLYVNVSADQMEAAIAEARRAGLPVLAHLDQIAAPDAVALGITEIEHLSGSVHQVHGGRRWAESANDAVAWAAVFLQAGTALCPTLVVWDRLSTINDAVFANDRRAEWVHPSIRTAWSHFPHRTIGATERMERQASVVAMKAALGALHAAGCVVVAGSDTPWPNVVPGFGLHDEIALLVDAGLPPQEALAAATSTAADVLGISHLVGRVKPGLMADLLVVDGDPLVNVNALSHIRAVVRMGSVLDHGTLFESVDHSSQAVPSDPVSILILGAAES